MPWRIACRPSPQAFRGEFAVFSPLPGCFEHFGLDFMVDEDFHVWLLEANPGPDFKQVRLTPPARARARTPKT